MTTVRTINRGFPVHGINTDPPPVLRGQFAIERIQRFGVRSVDRIPHRHEFNEFVLVHRGQGTHHVDFRAYPIEASQIFLLPRGLVHFWRYTGLLEVDLVLFRDEFLSGPGGLPPRMRWPPLEASPLLRPSSAGLRRVMRVLDGIEDEYGEPSETQAFALRSLLSVLLLECARMSPDEAEAPFSSLSREFGLLVLDRISARTTVQDCARQLGVTPGHLYDTVVAQTGTSPGEIVRGSLLREARRLLAGTDLTCEQIATELEFSSASYFSRFFKREAGVGPSEYRARFAG